MSEETKDGQNAGVVPQKTKKVNRLSTADLNTKISDFEAKNQTNSKYYKHLLERKKQLS